jgi:hypothetical protein
LEVSKHPKPWNIHTIWKVAVTIQPFSVVESLLRLTTHRHLVQRSWMSRSYTSSPPKRLHGV